MPDSIQLTDSTKESRWALTDKLAALAAGDVSEKHAALCKGDGEGYTATVRYRDLSAAAEVVWDVPLQALMLKLHFPDGSKGYYSPSDPAASNDIMDKLQVPSR